MRDFTMGPLPESDLYVRNQQQEQAQEELRLTLLRGIREANRTARDTTARKAARRSVQPTVRPGTPERRDNGASLKRHRDSVRETVRRTKQGRNIDEIMNRQEEETLVGYARGLLAAF